MSSAVADRDFAALLDRYGPQAAGCAVTAEEARRHCRRLATGHYENFPVLSVALPRRLRQDFANVYAFCRWADDLGDEVAGADDSLRLLDWWQAELDDCFAGRTWHPVFVALAETVARHDLPKRPFDDLISAFRQDQVKTRYETFDELRDYCRRSADPVGRIVLRLCGRYDERNVALSDSVCTGLQLVNFWQDVARDFAIGRVYLPREDRERFGYSEEDLANRRTTPAFLDLMRYEVDRARSLLRRGLPLADRLPGRLKAVIALFALGGLRICDRVGAIGYRVWDRRPTLTKADAVRLLANAAGRAVTASLRRPR
ncbi:MAG TPA: squalene synthase HpnC [Planctomycetaceae bacterium]